MYNRFWQVIDLTIEKIKVITENLSRIVMKPIYFGGLKITVCDVLRAKHSKNWIYGTHSHPWFEFNYVAKGSLFTTVCGKEFLAEKGSSYIIAPEALHSHRNNKSGDDGFCIRFTVEADKAAERETKKIMNALSVPQTKAFNSSIERMHLYESVPGIQAGFAAWVMLLYDRLHVEKAEEPEDIKKVSNLVFLYIEKYHGEKISAENIAAALNMSYRSLARKFKAETGKTVSESLTETRLSAAENLLIQSSLPLYEIAARCGYENEYYFSNIFKKQKGVSPSKFRKNFL